MTEGSLAARHKRQKASPTSRRVVSADRLMNVDSSWIDRGNAKCPVSINVINTNVLQLHEIECNAKS